MSKLKDLVSNVNKVTFMHYRHGEIWYTTDCGFQFPVPIADTGDGTFLATDRAMLYMRYIKRHIDVINKAKLAQHFST